VTVTLFGLGAVAGAVYVADSVVMFPLVVRAVTVKVPHAVPLQPGPLSDQASTLLGAEPGTGVSVATIVAVPPAGTLDGAASCSEKLLVMVTTAEAFAEGSATLSAVSVTLGGEGRMAGAV
jgi:hypothetical protein